MMNNDDVDDLANESWMWQFDVSADGAGTTMPYQQLPVVYQ